MDIKLARASKRHRRHLLLDYRAWQEKKPRCVSQTQWPIQCPYVLERILIQFKLVVGLILVLFLARLIKNWQAECAKFLDADDLKPNLKIYIRYRSAIFDERIRMPEGKKMITPREIPMSPDTWSLHHQPATKITSYIIFLLMR